MFDDFFPVFTEQFEKRINVIEMVDFLKLEFKDGGLLSWVNATKQEEMLKASESCYSARVGTSRNVCKLIDAASLFVSNLMSFYSISDVL